MGAVERMKVFNDMFSWDKAEEKECGWKPCSPGSDLDLE